MNDPVKRCVTELTAEGGITLTSALFEVQMSWFYIALNDKRATEKKNGVLCCLYLLSA